MALVIYEVRRSITSQTKKAVKNMTGCHGYVVSLAS